MLRRGSDAVGQRVRESLSPRKMTRPGGGACCTLGYLEDTVDATDKICVQPHVT